jgi:regulator of sigma E protease
MSLVIFIIFLSILVLVHEFGHFWVARRSGVWVEEFGFGLPPRVWGKKIGETIYSINLLPFGGFVRLHGENAEEGVTDKKRAFIFQGKLTRVKIVTAGVIMNFLLAIVAFSLAYLTGDFPRETENVRIVEVAPGSPAAEAGIANDEIVKSVDGVAVNNLDQFIELVNQKKGETSELVILKTTGETEIVDVMPREDPPEGEGAIGVAISNTEYYSPPLWQRPFLGIYFGFKEALFWGGTILVGLYTIIKNLFGGQIPSDVAGPVGIYALTTEASKYGFFVLINFLGVFSVNLAILNIFPFPALDGGRLLFIVLEGVLGKKVLPKIESRIHMAGMIILLLLLAAITIGDIKRLITAGGIGGFIESMTP